MLLSNGQLIDVTRAGGAYALSINASGQVIGQSQAIGQYPTSGFFYSGGTTITFTLGGGQSSASGLNDQAEVVGSATDASSTGHAFLYDQGVTTDLDTLIAAGDPLAARSISTTRLPSTTVARSSRWGAPSFIRRADNTCSPPLPVRQCRSR